MLEKYRGLLYISLIIVVVLAVGGASYLTFVYKPECMNYECWQGHMTRCSAATFINDEPEASWEYETTGMVGKQCAIRVSMLQAKQGELGIDRLVGEEMTCYYPEGIAAYAEKDLSKCHGLLKEDLQQIIISKLHAYILENLGKLNESLKSAV